MSKEFEGPISLISQEMDSMKYRQKDETFDEKIKRIAKTLSDGEDHKLNLENILGNQRFLPAGRVQSAIGAQKQVTAYNCFVSGTIEDSMSDIMDKAKEASETMRKGGGIGYDFSKIRPNGDWIKSLDSQSSGPVSFMGIFDSVCQTISSSGHRRGAQMGVLRVDHPDIETFITAKRNSTNLTGFNVSVGITDKFMECLNNGLPFPLTFEGKVYKTIDARKLWDDIMLSTWDWAEPGVLFIDRINDMNNLYYCETIEATNPCGEQPLPPYGACLLGSFNLTKYIKCESWNPIKEPHNCHKEGINCKFEFRFDKFKKDIPEVVRAMDNVVDRTIYPLEDQRTEAQNKRRMGLGVTGVANAGEFLSYEYGSPKFLKWFEKVLTILRNETYRASAKLAKEKGAFPMYRKEYLDGKFINTLPYSIKRDIEQYGIRNSHLTSIAPTGTISLVADNISSGIEPVFSYSYNRTINTPDGPIVEEVKDWGYSKGVNGKKSSDITVEEHLEVLALSQAYIDSAVSKTCNVGDSVTFEEFKDVYYKAWKMGCKGITTFRASGKRFGILNETMEEEEKTESKTEEVSKEKRAEACYIDPQTGNKECS